MATLYDVDQREGESMQSWYKRLARTADDRLRALEAYQHDQYYKPAIQWAYSVAQHDIQKWSGQHANRFNTKPPEDPEQLLAKISDIQKFLVSPTSTKRGITESYQKRADTINSKYGTKFTWRQMANLYESDLWTVMDKMFGSKTAMKVIGTIQSMGRKEVTKLKNKIAEADSKNEKIGKTSLVGRAVTEALKANSIQSLEQLFK